MNLGGYLDGATVIVNITIPIIISIFIATHILIKAIKDNKS